MQDFLCIQVYAMVVVVALRDAIVGKTCLTARRALALQAPHLGG